MSSAARMDALRLQAGLLYARQGVWPFVSAGVVVALLAVLAIVMPQISGARQKALDDARRMTEQLASLQAKPESERLSPAQGLARTLADQATTTATIRKLQEFATGMGLQVTQTDYRRLSGGAQQDYSELQIALPVKGNYPTLRLFLLTVMAEVPSLSVEQLIVKREQASSDQVDAQIYLSLWQRPAAGGAK
ncbi:MAG: GspMb/PilO family protein [Rhodocyclaceae bacterium]